MDFMHLEKNIHRLLAQYQTLQAENQRLQEEMKAVYQQNQLLQQKLEGAKTRVDHLLLHLPDA
jgi:outer membrane murein-binding lipoprotein Lpp